MVAVTGSMVEFIRCRSLAESRMSDSGCPHYDPNVAIATML